MASPGTDLQFLARGGAMGERIRAHAWRDTALGDPAGWPQSLRTTLRILLTTAHPMFLFWGDESLCFYNDAYAQSLGPEKHPAILGVPGLQAWAEIWPSIAPQIDQIMGGGNATWHKDQLLPIWRNGALEDVYWTYSYSPIDDPAAPHGVGGVLVICNETTDYVLAERRLSEERLRFVELFDQAPTFLALLEGPNHLIKLANAAYKRLAGDRPVVGRTVADALPEAVAQGYLKILDEVYTTGQPFLAVGAKYTPALAGGQPARDAYVDFVYQPMTGPDGRVSGILVQGVDVTARALADQALAASRARLDYATRLSGVGFWYCDLPFDVLEWDERVKEHFFLPPDARVTIDDFFARIHPEDREATRAAIDASLRTRIPYDVVYRTVHPTTGAVKWIRALGGTDYDAHGTPTYFDGVTVDVTAQKLAEQHLATLNERLREQDRLKDEFIATLSHELRNPLAPIRAAAQVVVSPQATAAQLQQAQRIIERQVRHMALLLDDLLDVARITRGKLQLKKRPVSLFDVIEAAVEAGQPAMAAKSQSLRLDLPPETLRLDADPLRLAQVVSNLLTNASKYSEPGTEITVAAVREGPVLRLSVSDQGIGIPQDALGRIFDMFAQLEDSQHSADGGLGIGLALVKGLTELHGGTVEARSDGPGTGSEFILRLPLGVPPPGSPAPALAGQAVRDHRRKVLIADDNPDAADSLCMFLQLEGHEVRVANGGRAALAQAHLFCPDVALLDIAMPDMSGYEVARQLRAAPWAAQLQLVAITGWGQEEHTRRAREAGFDEHMCKPIDLQLLLAVLRRERQGPGEAQAPSLASPGPAGS